MARRFGAGAGLLAALFLAITPISVAVDRATIPDACLGLVLFLASWALLRAGRGERRRRVPSAPRRVEQVPRCARLRARRVAGGYARETKVWVKSGYTKGASGACVR